MTYGYIYKIEFPNGKHYIGLTTTSLYQRQSQHRCSAKNGAKKYLYNALRKYKMEDTFDLIEIDTADTLEELCEKEIQYIKEYNSYYMNKKGYNMTHGGEGNFGYIHTEECKQKMSEIQKKRFDNNTEAREKCSKSQIKRFENSAARRVISEKMKQYFEDAKAIEKNSAAVKKYFENTKAREHISEKMKQYHQNNPEIKEINNEAQKKYYKENPESRRKLSDGKGKNIPFDVFTKDGTFIKTFNYQFEAKEYLQKEYHITSIINIGEVLSGKRNSSAGFVFKYK